MKIKFLQTCLTEIVLGQARANKFFSDLKQKLMFSMVVSVKNTNKTEDDQSLFQ